MTGIGAPTAAHANAVGLATVTAVIVNYRTLAYTRRAIESFRTHYADVPLIIVDNGSNDDSAKYIADLALSDSNTIALFNHRNLYHGPALDQGIRVAQTRYVFTLDSDAEINAEGFLQRMLEPFLDEMPLYAVGELRYKSRYGYTFGYEDDEQHGRRFRIRYVHPWAMLLDRERYLRLPPFAHHGAPCLTNMRAAQTRGYVVRHFPVSDFITHHGAGTSFEHGYGVPARLRQIVERQLELVESQVFSDPTLEVRVPARLR